MRIDSGQTASMLYSAFGQQGMRSAQSRETEEENHLPTAAVHKVAEKMKSVEATLSTGVTLKEQQALTYSHAVKAPASFGAVGMAHASVTDSGTQKTAIGTTSQEEESSDLKGMPFSRESIETAADEAIAETGKTEEAGRPGKDKAGEGEKDRLDDPVVKNEIRKLGQREREVIAHEAAHKAVGGQYASAATYTYTTGPDDKKYISGGEVAIRTPATSDPEEALRLAELVKRAALAPANPSSQDISVAASATQKVANARAEISRVAREEAAEKRADAKDEKAETGKTSSDSTENKKTTETESSGITGIHARKAADAYASLSGIHQHGGNGGRLHTVG